jgi:hypothetical protein
MFKKLGAIALSLWLSCINFAYAEQLVTVDQFKGLQSNPVAAKIADGAHTRFDNVYIKDGNIRALKGRVKLNTTAHADTVVNMFCYYQNTAGSTKKLIVKESDEVVTYAIDGTGRTSIASTLTNEPATCTQVGDTFYWNSSTDGLYKWTGSGSASAVGSVSAPSNVSWSAASSTGGMTSGLDAIVAKIGSVASGYTWNGASCVATDITSMNCSCDNLSCTGTSGGSGSNCFNSTHYTKACATSTTYKYKLVYYNTQYGIESEASSANSVDLTGADTVSAQARDAAALLYTNSSCTSTYTVNQVCDIVVSGRKNATSATLGSTPSGLFNSYRIYRTVASGSEYFLVGEQATGAVTDGKPDVALGDPLDTTIDTIAPPSFKHITAHLGVLFAAENNTLYFTRLPVGAVTNADTYWLELDQLALSSEQVITGMRSTKDALLVFTATDIFDIRGFGQTFRISKLISNIGAVSGNTITEDSNGDIIFFSGIRGVYKLQVGRQLSSTDEGEVIGRTDTTIKRLSAPGMDSIFRGEDSKIDLDPANYPSANAYYDRDNDLYFLFIGSDGFVYDNISQAWSHVPNVKASASVYYAPSNAVGYGIFVDDLGFFYRNFYGYVNGATSGTVTGSPTSSGATTLTDTGATFYTTNDGLKGVYVCVENATTKNLQCRRITSNTGTQLTVDAWASNPTTSDTYFVGYIHVDIETKQYNLSKPPRETQLMKLHLVHEKSDSAQNLFIDSYTNKNTTTNRTITLDLNTYYIDLLGVTSRGSWHQLRFRSHIYNTSDTINVPVNIENYTMHVVGREAE